MALTIQVDGLATISIGIGTSAIAQFGYTENGVEITEQTYPFPVYTDENGGDAGPEVDIQQMGQTHIIRMLMTKYDEAIANIVRAGLAGGTAGTVATAGALHFASGGYWRVLINSVLRPRNYLQCVFNDAKEINKGTKHSKFMVIAKAFKGENGVLYNTTLT